MKSTAFPRVLAAIVLTILVVLVSAASAEAQIGITGSTYSQNFDTLASQRHKQHCSTNRLGILRNGSERQHNLHRRHRFQQHGRHI